MVEIRGPYSTHELHPEVFDPEECARIIEIGTALPADEGGIEGDDGLLRDDSLRTAEIAWIAHDPDTVWIHERLQQVCCDDHGVDSSS